MTLDVAVIGSGFGGLGAAITLRERGVTNVAIFERADDLGGTWRDNRYPGCRCDVASNLYSYSFAPNPKWSNTFSFQPEIWQYLSDVADRYRTTRTHTVRSRRASRSRSTPSRNSGRSLPATASTPLAASSSRPAAWPNRAFPTSTDSRRSPVRVMHTATWDDTVALDGERVGVIGTGASSIQVVPQIAARVGRLEVFQRTPSWILPHMGHPVLERTKRLFTTLSLSQRLARSKVYWRNELMVLGFVKDPTRMSRAETIAREHLERQLPDSELREKFTPHYRLGCKRVLISNDFYPTFNRENVSLVTERHRQPSTARRSYSRRRACTSLT